MEWNVKYEIGVLEIDQQHKSLVECINKYKSQVTNDKENMNNIKQTLSYLVNYTSYHFEQEESFMYKINYPDLDAHKIIHKDIVLQLRNIILKFKNKDTVTNLEFYYFLTNWLNDHILGTDMQIKQYYTNVYKGEIITPECFISIEDTYSKIKKNLFKVDDLYQNGSININDRDIKRLIYLQTYFETIMEKETALIKNICISLLKLTDEKIITEEELNIIFLHLSLEKNIITEEIKQIKNIIKL